SHLATIHAVVRPGQKVKMGQLLGLLGKEGGSGGWSHLHFDISGRQPSGKWGIIEGYAFLWEAYLKQYQPRLLAVARPHYLATVGIRPGDPVQFRVRTSRTTDGNETWDFGDGSPKVQVQSDGNVVPLAKDGYARTVHRFTKAGHYLVRVERTNRHGHAAIAH